MNEDVYEAWHEWMWRRWRERTGFWFGGYALFDHVEYSDYDGFAAGID